MNDNSKLLPVILMVAGIMTFLAGISLTNPIVMGLGGAAAVLGIRMRSKTMAALRGSNSRQQQGFVLDDKAIMRLASRLGGSLTAQELSMHTKLSLDQAQSKLDEMYSRGLTDLNLTDEGVMVYRFLQLPPSGRDKSTAKPVL